jgi:GT2 family glycosyltransferase
MVVDNGSDEDPTAILQEKFPGIHVHCSPRNMGVAGGRNVGIRWALEHGYQYVLLLDNDACADRKMISKLIKAADQNSDVGILGPKILREDSPGIILRAGCTSWKWTYLHAGHIILKRIFQWAGKPLPNILDTSRGENQLDAGQFDIEDDVDFQIGCAQLVRAEVFHDIGLLDEDFSPYGSEDIDFCARAKHSGWRIRYVPQATCRHRAGGSFQDEYERAYYNARHLMLLARKDLSPVYFWLLYLPDLVFLTLPLMMAESILQKKSRRRKALFDATLWNLADMKKRGILIGHPAFSPVHRTDDSWEV